MMIQSKVEHLEALKETEEVIKISIQTNPSFIKQPNSRPDNIDQQTFKIQDTDKIILQQHSQSPFKQQIDYQSPQSVLSFQSQIAVHNIFEWKAEIGRLEKFTIIFHNRTIPIAEISKLKCLSQEAIGQKRKIKISLNQVQDIFFATEVETFRYGFPVHYFWFAKIVCSKLTEMGYDLEKPFAVMGMKNFNISIDKFFCRGFLYKRSQFFKKWQLRYIVINEDGLFSYKKQNQSCSFSIKAKEAKYIWTRFEIYDDNLVIKIKHGLEKTEFGIPITNFCRKGTVNWLYSFYRMIMQKNINKILG